jgi:hypothetical protein
MSKTVWGIRRSHEQIKLRSETHPEVLEGGFGGDRYNRPQQTFGSPKAIDL